MTLDTLRRPDADAALAKINAVLDCPERFAHLGTKGFFEDIREILTQPKIFREWLWKLKNCPQPLFTVDDTTNDQAYIITPNLVLLSSVFGLEEDLQALYTAIRAGVANGNPRRIFRSTFLGEKSVTEYLREQEAPTNTTANVLRKYAIDEFERLMGFLLTDPPDLAGSECEAAVEDLVHMLSLKFKDRHEGLVLTTERPDWLVSVGAAVSAEGAEIVVYAKTYRAKVPTTWQGYPVRVVVTGEVLPL